MKMMASAFFENYPIRMDVLRHPIQYTPPWRSCPVRLGSRLAPRVGIDSRHTVVDDAVNFIALPKRDTKALGGHRGTRNDKTNSADSRDCLPKLRWPYWPANLRPSCFCLNGVARVEGLVGFSWQHILGYNRTVYFCIPNKLNGFRCLARIIEHCVYSNKVNWTAAATAPVKFFYLQLHGW